MWLACSVAVFGEFELLSSAQRLTGYADLGGDAEFYGSASLSVDRVSFLDEESFLNSDVYGNIKLHILSLLQNDLNEFLTDAKKTAKTVYKITKLLSN